MQFNKILKENDDEAKKVFASYQATRDQVCICMYIYVIYIYICIYIYMYMYICKHINTFIYIGSFCHRSIGCNF
jgi:hypothetical protein